MKKEMVITAANRQYAEAYKKQFTSKDMLTALELYKEIVVSYPDSEEAGYSQSQIQNIIHDVVPKEVLYKAQLDMALKYAKHSDEPKTQPV